MHRVQCLILGRPWLLGGRYIERVQSSQTTSTSCSDLLENIILTGAQRSDKPASLVGLGHVPHFQH